MFPNRNRETLHPVSWVIREKESKRVLFETFNPHLPPNLNTAKYEAIPIAEYLASINGRK